MPDVLMSHGYGLPCKRRTYRRRVTVVPDMGSIPVPFLTVMGATNASLTRSYHTL